MLTQYSLRLPNEVFGGVNALDNIKGIVKKGQRAVLFTDKGVKGAGLLKRPAELIMEAGGEVEIIDEIPAEPTCDQAQKVAEQFWNLGGDIIIAVGGGSVMDLAKLASVTSPQCSVRDLLTDPARGRKTIKTLMIPTTAGTGAEATPNSIVAVPEKELKVGIVNPRMIADFVILDGEMIKDLPRKIAAATGVDALAHAIECFTSKKATPFSNLFALEALDLIMNNIEKACDSKDALEEKNKMLLAAFYAGIAITASGTTAVHALSYPLGGKYHIPHGVSNAMLLVPVMKFNKPLIEDLLAVACDRVTGNNTGGETKNNKEKSSWMIGRLEEITNHLGIPANLGEYGIGEDDLDSLVGAAMDVKRLLVNNMREVTAADARKLYLKIM